MNEWWAHEPAKRPAFDGILDRLERLADDEKVSRLALGVTSQRHSHA